MSLLIIDADSLAYKACCIAEKTIYDILPLEIQGIPSSNVVDIDDYDSYQQFVIQSFEYVSKYKEWLGQVGKTKDDFLRISRVEVAPLSHALQILKRMMNDCISAVEPNEVTVLLTGDNNFRDEVAKMRPYKESRIGKPKPFHHHAVREYMVKQYGAKIIDGCEADDMCGILAQSCVDNYEPYVIAHIDKDLNSIPGMHYNYDKKTWYQVSAYEAEHWFFVQVLAGDSTDCIPGLYKVGEVMANKILGKSRSYASMLDKVRQAYTKGLTKDRATTEQRYARYKTPDELLTEMGQLIHMQRYVGEMWTPTGD